MSNEAIKVLLVDDNLEDVRRVHAVLSDAEGAAVELEVAGTLSDALCRLGGGGIDVVMLDLSLPDSTGLETLSGIRAEAPTVPVVVLTDTYDPELALRTVQNGAQDYVLKEHLNPNMILRIIRYAIERQRLLAEIRSLSLIDDLTGLHNRRGFLTLGQQQLNMADRTSSKMLLVYIDLDNMKWINDTFGHSEGDLALIEVANVLKETFRKSDIIARIGGDEFAILAIETSSKGAERLASRLEENLKRRNANGSRPYNLSVSMGIARYDPEQPCSILDLVDRADRLMYEQKRSKRESGRMEKLR